MREGPKLQVNIHENCEVDYEVVNVRKSVGEQVEWHSDGEGFTIEFESSPFSERVRKFRPGQGRCALRTLSLHNSQPGEYGDERRPRRRRKALK